MVVKVDVHAWGKVILIILLTTKSSRMKKEGLYIQNKPYGWRNKKIQIRASIFANRKEMEEEKKKGRDVSFDISIKPSGWIMAIWVRWSRQYMSKFMLESSLRLKEGECLNTWHEESVSRGATPGKNFEWLFGQTVRRPRLRITWQQNTIKPFKWVNGDGQITFGHAKHRLGIVCYVHCILRGPTNAKSWKKLRD